MTDEEIAETWRNASHEEKTDKLIMELAKRNNYTFTRIRQILIKQKISEINEEKAANSEPAEPKPKRANRTKIAPKLAEEIRKLRAKGLTYAQICVKCGVSRATVYRYIKESKNMTFAEELNVQEREELTKQAERDACEDGAVTRSKLSLISEGVFLHGLLKDAYDDRYGAEGYDFEEFRADKNAAKITCNVGGEPLTVTIQRGKQIC